MYSHQTDREPTLAALRARLQRFLPVELAQQLQANELNPVARSAIVAHMADLVASLGAAVPRWVRGANPADPLPALGDEQTLLFADMTGFTALTEQLGVLGRAGTEELTGLINTYFAALVEIALEWGGDLLAFGGDAILVAFSGQGHAFDAAGAAQAMQAALPTIPPVRLPGWPDPLQLQMKVGIASGPLVLAAVGTSERRCALALGSVLATTDAMANDTDPGGIRLDPRAAALLAPFAELEPQPNGSALLRKVRRVMPEDSRRTAALATNSLVQLVERAESLAPYLPEEIVRSLIGQPQVTPGSGQQRQVVSMFTHLDGLHALADTLGSAQAARIAAAAALTIGRARAIIENHGGVLARVDCYDTGHKLLSLFGAPRAREHDALRAAQAALALRETLPAINADLAALLGQEPPLPVRARSGINTGIVLAGQVGTARRWEYTVMGDTTNVAARLMGKGSLDESSVLVGPDAFALLGSAVQAQPIELKLKGKTGTLTAYAVRELRSGTPRRTLRNTRLVGRETERSQLAAAVQYLASGQSQTLIIDGEPGVGKSRLLREAITLIGNQALCLHSGLPGLAPASFSLFRDPLRVVLCGLPQSAAPALVRDRLRRTLEKLCPGQAAELLPACALLLGLGTGSDGIDAEDQLAAVTRAVATVLEAVVREQPLALLCEDLHDADSASLALLERLLPQLSRLPVLVCLTLRTNSERSMALARRLGEAATQSDGTVVRLHLEGLNATAGTALLDLLLPGLAAETRSALMNHADGNPLFLEMLSQAVRERGLLQASATGLRLRASLAELQVPLTLGELIAAQLDQLPAEVGRLAHAAAVITAAEQDFSLALLASALNVEQSVLTVRLAELERADVVESAGRDGRYRFRHALFQQVAYDQLLERDRRTLHRRIGLALHMRNAEEREQRIAALAHHLYEGQVWELALGYSLVAGEQARQLYANREARRFLHRALGLARRLGYPEREAVAREGLGALGALRGRYKPARAQLERALRLGARLDAGLAEMEAQARRRRLLAHIGERISDYDQAERDCRNGLMLTAGLGLPNLETARLYSQLAEILWRRGDYDGTADAARSGLAALPPVPEAPRERAALLRWQSLVASAQGRYSEAITGLEQSLTLARQTGDTALIAHVLMNIGNCCDASGDVIRAHVSYQESLELMERVGDTNGYLTTLLNYAGWLQIRGQYNEAITILDRCCWLSTRHSMHAILADALTNLGYIHYMQDHYDQAEEQFQQALELFRQQDDSSSQTDVLYRLGDVALACSNALLAISYSEQALDKAIQIDSSVYTSCALRVLGEAYLLLGQLDRATDLLDQSWQAQLDSDDPFDRTLLLVAQARLALANGKQTEARRKASAALALANEAQSLHLDQLVATLLTDLHATVQVEA